MVVAAPVRPVNTTAPSVAGSWVVGETVTGSPGVWSGSPSPSLAYQWQRCDAARPGCVRHGEWPGGYGFELCGGGGDVGSTLRLVVTARKVAGSSSAASPVGSVVVAAPVRPVNTTAPSVSGTWTAGGDGVGVAGGVVGR